MISKRIAITMSAFVLFAGMHRNAYAAPAAGKTVSATGCLVKGDEPNEFSITGSNGKKYGLKSSSVNLSEHLGHKVMVKGTLKKEGNEKDGDERDNDEGKSGSKEAGDLDVTSLKMISSTCK